MKQLINSANSEGLYNSLKCVEDRKFAVSLSCAFVRRALHLTNDECSIYAIKTAKRYLNGEVSEDFCREAADRLDRSYYELVKPLPCNPHEKIKYNNYSNAVLIHTKTAAFSAVSCVYDMNYSEHCAFAAYYSAQAAALASPDYAIMLDAEEEWQFQYLIKKVLSYENR